MKTTSEKKTKMTSRYAGKCEICGEPIAVGQSILWDRRGGAVHATDECIRENDLMAWEEQVRFDGKDKNLLRAIGKVREDAFSARVRAEGQHIVVEGSKAKVVGDMAAGMAAFKKVLLSGLESLKG